jgi:TIR domain
MQLKPDQLCTQDIDKMSTLRQYFDSDFKGFFGLVGPLKLRVNEKPIDPPVERAVLYNHDSRAAFHAIYVPPDLPAVEVCSFILQDRDLFDGLRRALHIEVGPPGEPPAQISNCLFTGRVILYVNSNLGDGEKQALTAVAQSEGLDLILRDRSYAAMKDTRENPHAFISHDWRDKENIARPLAVSLAHNLCKVWYDEFSLNIGDSLRDKIEHGLKHCRKCVS